MTAEVHKCEEAKQTIVVGIEVAILEGFVLSIPQGIDKLLLLSVVAEDRGGSNGANQAYAVAQLAESACWNQLIFLGQRAISAILIDKLIDTLSVEEVLDGLTILLLPLGIGPTPLVIECDIHRHAPRVVAEVVATIAAWFLSLRALRHAWETRHLHLAAIVLTHIGIQTRLRVDALVDPCLGGSLLYTSGH